MVSINFNKKSSIKYWKTKIQEEKVTECPFSTLTIDDAPLLIKKWTPTCRKIDAMVLWFYNLHQTTKVETCRRMEIFIVHVFPVGLCNFPFGCFHLHQTWLISCRFNCNMTNLRKKGKTKFGVLAVIINWKGKYFWI